MKLFPIILFCSALLPVAAFAEGSAENGESAFPRRACEDAPRISVPAENDGDEPPPPPSFSKEEARILKSLFLLSDEQLHRLSGFIRHLEKMPIERRRQMAEDLERMCFAQTPEQRKAHMKEMRERFRKNQENLLARHYATLPPEQAEAEKKKFLEMTREERRAYLADVRKKLGYEPLPPPPPPKERRGARGEGARRPAAE